MSSFNLATPPQQPRNGRYKDMCAEHKVSRNTVYRWTKDPTFPAPRKRGQVVMFDMDAVAEWLDKSEGQL